MPVNYILFVNAADTSRHKPSANGEIYPNLGLITLMSSLQPRLEQENYRVGYFDGTVYGNHLLEAFIEKEYKAIFALCFSVLTSNYMASLDLITRAKELNGNIITMLGNDHFSALYKEVMVSRKYVDYGFYGSDVVEGFSNLMTDLIQGTLKDLSTYPGLVYRDEEGGVRKNPENPAEYSSLPLVDYSLVDSLMPHQKLYLEGQQRTYFFMRDRNLKSQVVDIGRGCVKFAGERLNGIPLNACDFCGIIPGSKAIVSKGTGRAWQILKNVYDQGFNYFYITADELPLTLWKLLKEMSENIPDWYKDLPERERPKMFGYARAEGFATHPERIDTIVTKLSFDHFFIGFDGLSEISLRVMNKQPVRDDHCNLMSHNMGALQLVVEKGALITAGLVLTHLGITPAIMKQNFEKLSEIVNRYPKTFAALDFTPLCPIPGSQSFYYLKSPPYAEKRAGSFGLKVNSKYLKSVSDKYKDADSFEMDELIEDFILGCCPEISPDLVDEYVYKMNVLAKQNDIVVGGGL